MAKNTQTIDAIEWANKALGISEFKWDYANIPTNILDAAGTFNMLTLHQLRAMLPTQYKRDTAPYIIYRVRDSNHKNDDLFDTNALQYDSHQYNRPLFQVASNYNCIELANSWDNPFNGTYLSKIMIDSTQGPSASGGAGSGAILRNSIHRWGPLDERPLLDDIAVNNTTDLDSNNIEVNRQRDYSKDNIGGYINLLSEVPELANIAVNGKLHNNKKISKLVPIYNMHDETWIYNIRVGIQEGVRAQYYRARERCYDGYCIYNEYGPRIDQVYTSTCIIESASSANNSFTKAMLKAAYDGTYLAAVKRQSKELILTLIGGNAFNNPIKLIIEAMAEAHEKYGKYLHPKCKVLLPIYNENWGYICSIIENNANIFKREM